MGHHHVLDGNDREHCFLQLQWRQVPYSNPSLPVLRYDSRAYIVSHSCSVTKEMSATTRMVLDSVRTLTIWIYSMLVGWEDFQYLQVVGFVFLLNGTFIYNNIIVVPLLRRFKLLPPVIQHHGALADSFQEKTDDQMRPLLD